MAQRLGHLTSQRLERQTVILRELVAYIGVTEQSRDEG